MKEVKRLDENVDCVNEESRVLLIDVLDGDLEVFLDVAAVLELLRVFEGMLKELVDQSHAILPVLLGSVGPVEFFELGVVGSKILLGDCFVEDYFFKLVVLDLDPKVVFSLRGNTLEQLLYSLKSVLSEFSHVPFPVLVQLQDQFGQSLALRP